MHMKYRAPRHFLTVFVSLIYSFMLLPFAFVVITSFDANPLASFPPKELTLRWWHAALAADWLKPLFFSFYLAVLTAAISTVLGLLLAFALVRWRFPGRSMVSTLTFGPLLLSNLVIGVALLQTIATLGLLDLIGFYSLLIGHIIIALPYAVRTIGISLGAIPNNLERAAMNLGANRRQVLRTIIFPLIVSGTMAGAVFGFVHSFNDVDLSMFLSSPTEQVINVKILGELTIGFQPVVAAVSVIMLAVPLAIVYVIGLRFGISKFLYGGR